MKYIAQIDFFFKNEFFILHNNLSCGLFRFVAHRVCLRITDAASRDAGPKHSPQGVRRGWALFLAFLECSMAACGFHQAGKQPGRRRRRLILNPERSHPETFPSRTFCFRNLLHGTSSLPERSFFRNILPTFALS